MADNYNEDGYMIVRENHCCDHFEPDYSVLVPMKECWCCKWASFDTEVHDLEHKSVGVCHYEGNSVQREAGCSR